MSKLEIVKTDKTPHITGDINAGTFSIIGKSLPVNAREFFGPVLDWLNDFYNSPSKNITIDIDMEYYNTSSSGILFKMLEKFKEMEAKHTVKIYWHFEEDDIEIEEEGLEFKSALGDIIELKQRKYRPRATE